MRVRSHIFLGLVLVLSFGAGVSMAQQAAGELVDGFEELTKAQTADSHMTAVTGGNGVTQGKQAAQLPAGASFTIPISGASCLKLAWLKIDTLTTQPVAQRLELTFSGKDAWVQAPAIVQAGQDVLALPTSVVTSRPNNWPREEINLTIKNTSAWPIVLDNIRLEAAAKAPEGSSLMDLGPKNQAVWPGFKAGQVEDINWSGKNTIRDRWTSFPDPLQWDFISPEIKDKIEDSFCLSTPGNSPAVAWIWVTHYSTQFFQPAEYYLRIGGKNVLGKRLTARQMMGPEGMMIGINGEWTPQWYDKSYCGQLADVAQVNLQAGRNQVDVGNCQLAGVAMAPAGERAAMTAYIDQVKKDLTRYHRQFVVGQRIETVCDLPATDEENRSGVMAFAPTADDVISPSWVPTENDRSKAVRQTVYNGGEVVIPLAIVPLKKAGVLTAGVSPLHAADGKTLPARMLEVFFLERLPRIQDAQVGFWPWGLSHKATPTRDREVVVMAVVLQTNVAASDGDYTGAIRIAGGGGLNATIPLEVKVVSLGAEGRSHRYTLGGMGNSAANDMYGNLAQMLEPAQLEKLTAKLRAELLSGGLNSLVLSAAGLKKELTADPASCQVSLRSVPKGAITGQPVLELGGAAWRLQDRNINPGTQLYSKAIAEAVRSTRVVASQAGLSEPILLAGWANNRDNFDTVVMRCPAVTAAGGRAGLMVSEELFCQQSEDSVRKMAGSAAAIFLYMGGGMPAANIDVLKKMTPARDLYLCLTQPDTYTMGFYAWAMGASGSFCDNMIWREVGPYSGVGFFGQPLLIPDSNLAAPSTPTVGLLRARQGQSDFLLAQRAAALVQDARTASVDASEVQKILDGIREKARAQKDWPYDRSTLGFRGMTAVELETLRNQLIEAAGKLAKDLRKK